MRTIAILAALTLAPAVGFAEDTAPVATAPAPAAEVKPINTICPVSGAELKADSPKVTVTVGEGDKAQTLCIGVSCGDCAKKVEADPAKYAAAAQANKKYEEAAPK